MYSGLIHNMSLSIQEQPTSCADHGYIPASSEFFEDLSITERVLVWTCCVLSLLTMVVYIENMHLVLHLDNSHWLDRRATVWILSVMPLTSLSSVMNLCLPRSASVPDLVASIAFALGVLHFKMEVMGHFGGTEMIVRALQSVRIPLSSPPFCYFRFCCPSFQLSRFKYRLISCCVLQSAILQPLTALSSVIIFMEDAYRYRQMTTSAPIFYFIIVRCASTLVGVYGLSLVVAATEPVWKPLDIAPKHLILKTWLGLFNIQGLIFTLLGLHGIPPCTGRVSSRVRGKAMMSIVLVVEILVVTVLTRHFYHSSNFTLDQDGHLTDSKDREMSSVSCVDSKSFTDSSETQEIVWPEISDSSCIVTDSSLVSEGRRADKRSPVQNYGAITSMEVPHHLDIDQNGVRTVSEDSNVGVAGQVVGKE